MRFGQNAVKTPGRTHDNYCVTKGLKVSLKPFQRLGVAHVGRSPRPEDPKGRSPVRAGVGHGPEGIKATALQSTPPQIHPGGVFCADEPSNRGERLFVKRLIVHAPGKGASAFGHGLIWPGDLPVQTGKIHKFLEVFPYDSSNGLTK